MSTNYEIWWARQDSNLQPDGYEPPALTIELRAPIVMKGHSIAEFTSRQNALVPRHRSYRNGEGVTVSSSQVARKWQDQLNAELVVRKKQPISLMLTV